MLPEPLRDLLEAIALFRDPADRASVLLGFADQFTPVPPEIATPPYPEDHRVSFCESEAYAWLILQEDGTATLHFAVENPSGVSAKALAFVLSSTLSGSTPEVIEQVSPDIVEQIFRQDISMGKGMGLAAMVQTVRALARRARTSMTIQRAEKPQ